MWTEPNDVGGDMLKQVRICNSREFYNAESQMCEVCPGATTGTTEFQQTYCKSCGDMWFETQDQPDSMEAIVARQLCQYPNAVYLNENPPPIVEEEKIEEVKEEDKVVDEIKKDIETTENVSEEVDKEQTVTPTLESDELTFTSRPVKEEAFYQPYLDYIMET